MSLRFCATFAGITLLLLPALRPTGRTVRTEVWRPRIIVEHGAGVRWDHEPPPAGLPDSEEAPSAALSTRRVAARHPAPEMQTPGLILLGTENWAPVPQPSDLDSFAMSLRAQLSAPAAALGRTSKAMAVHIGSRAGQLAFNRSNTCLAGCSGRGRCDQLIGRCVCRHGYRGRMCQEAVPQICNDPREKCVGRDCHEWTRFVSRCSGECDLSSNRCKCGARARYPDRDMFMCEWRGIEQLTHWRSPGWAHFTLAEAHQFWSAPNTTPPWFEQTIGRAKLRRLWRTSKLQAQDAQGAPQHRPSFVERASAALLPARALLAPSSGDDPTAPAHATSRLTAEHDAHTTGIAPTLAAAAAGRRFATTAADGSPLAWCDRPPTMLAERTAARHRYPRCQCYEDRGGPTCSLRVRSFCLNQCSDRGQCVRGFCMCDTGWSGSDCSIPMVPVLGKDAQARLGLPAAGGTASLAATSSTAAAVAAVYGAPLEQSLSAQTTRLALRGGQVAALRPAIYVYELPVWYNGWLHETRLHPQDCTYRRYQGSNNATEWENYAFGLELALHEVTPSTAILLGPHHNHPWGRHDIKTAAA